MLIYNDVDKQQGSLILTWKCISVRQFGYKLISSNVRQWTKYDDRTNEASYNLQQYTTVRNSSYILGYT